MQINLDDIMFIGDKFAGIAAESHFNDEKDNCSKLSIEKIVELKHKYSKRNILNTEYSFEIVREFISGCMISYHEQLRKILLEQSIDIGDIDFEATGIYRAEWKKQHQDDYETDE